MNNSFAPCFNRIDFVVIPCDHLEYIAPRWYGGRISAECQPSFFPEVFYKNRFSWQFLKIHKKIPVSELPF